MNEDYNWRNSPLSILLKRSISAPHALSVFESYLGSENKQYQSIQMLSKNLNMPCSLIENMIENCKKLVQFNEHQSYLQLVLNSINELIDEYKGVVLVSSWSKTAKEKLSLEYLSAMRYLRFAEIMQNRIYVDTRNMIFWNRSDKCMNCMRIRSALEKYKGNMIENWDKILAKCKEIDCPVKPESKLDPGMIKYHHPDENVTLPISTNIPLMDEEIPAHRNVSDESAKSQSSSSIMKDGKAEYSTDDLCLNKISPNSQTILAYLLKHKEGVSKIKLSAHGKLIKTDPMAAILEINDNFYTELGRELIELDMDTGKWKVDSECLAQLTDDTMHNPANSFNGGHQDESISTQASDKLDSIMPIIKESLEQSRTSYKIYWAQALMYFAVMGKHIITYKEIASLMCFFAWSDSNSGLYDINVSDHLFVTINRLQNKLNLSQDDIEASRKMIEGSIGNYDSNRITAAVKLHFIPKRFRPISDNDTQQSKTYPALYTYKNGILHLSESFAEAIVKEKNPIIDLLNDAKQRSLHTIHEKA